jgi:hypothetical protein
VEGDNFSSRFAMCHSFSACFRMEAVLIGVCKEGGSRSVGISLGCQGGNFFQSEESGRSECWGPVHDYPGLSVVLVVAWENSAAVLIWSFGLWFIHWAGTCGPESDGGEGCKLAPCAFSACS